MGHVTFMQILISKHGKRFGPYSEEQVNGYVRRGHFCASDLAWHKGVPKWAPLAQVMELPPVDPYAPPRLPGSFSSNGAYSNAEIIVIANRQKAMIWLILASVAATGSQFFPFLDMAIVAADDRQNAMIWLKYTALLMFVIRFVVMGILSMVFVYRLARATRSPEAGVYAVLALIPFVSLVGLLIVSSDATAALRRRGIRVGLMGANKDDLEKLKVTS